MRIDSARACLSPSMGFNGFFFPDRFPATVSYRRSAREGGRRFDIIRVTPQGSRPLDIWFDRRTHLIKRVIDKGAPRRSPSRRATIAASTGSPLPTCSTSMAPMARWLIAARLPRFTADLSTPPASVRPRRADRPGAFLARHHGLDPKPCLARSLPDRFERPHRA
ncbi:MAG: hypothetical protein B7Y45_05085 [Sphingomonas sp. 28-66-16]|nr:MAG: hypothetical protein B7Y45_05085 [Sphingomonas sp. 28-66-16]